MDSSHHTTVATRSHINKRGPVGKIELWDKRIVVDGEDTQLTPDEKDYVWFEE